MNPNNNRGNEGEEEAQQRRIKPWGAADKRFLSSLITDGDVDIYSTDNGYIDRIREEYFPNRTERNFRRNFLNFSAEWDTEKAVEGGRRLEAGNESEDIVEEAEESTSEDNMMPATKKAAKAAPKKKAGPKTTGDVKGDDFVANVSPQPVDDRSYNINMADGWIRVQYSEGLVDYIMIEFHVNGILPEGGWRIVFNEDENKVSFQRAIHKFLFSKEHLSSIMNPGEYSSTHSRVVAVDHSAQRMMTDRVEESGDFFWGRAQVVNLNVKCTGTPQISYKAYKSGLIVGRHKQYNCVCTCRVQVAAQRTETMQRVEKGVVQMFDLPSSQSSMDSPPDRRKPKGNKRSYVDDSPDGY